MRSIILPSYIASLDLIYVSGGISMYFGTCVELCPLCACNAFAFPLSAVFVGFRENCCGFTCAHHRMQHERESAATIISQESYLEHARCMARGSCALMGEG